MKDTEESQAQLFLPLKTSLETVRQLTFTQWAVTATDISLSLSLSLSCPNTNETLIISSGAVCAVGTQHMSGPCRAELAW